MKTLIELYDERPVENVLGTETFRPEETIFICPPEVDADTAMKAALAKYFEQRGCPAKLTFVPVSLLDANKVQKTLRHVIDTHEDCALDISGGTDAALFAAGAVSGDLPVYTYSHKKNTFFEISHAPFARNLKCQISLDVESCLLMAGGRLLPGREDNTKLTARLDDMGRLFEVYRRYRRIWNQQVSYIQRLSSSSDPELGAEGARTAKADHGLVTADEALFRALEAAGMIHELHIDEARIEFRFHDSVTRFWLRDMGSVLELHVYRACLLAGCFDDTVLSAVVNWHDADIRGDAVTNEIDVMAVRGVVPVFISCKTSEVKTEALNELAILRDRFGGVDSRAILVTSGSATKGRVPMRRRAAELGIELIEWQDLTEARLLARLRGS